MIPKNLKLSRENLDIKQKDVADFFNLSKSTISGWENGIDIIPIKKLIMYANKYSLSLDYIFGLKNYNELYSPIILDLNVLASHLLKMRKKHLLTQVQLSKLMNTSQSTYSKYETGQRIIPTIFLCELIRIYSDISIDEIFGRDKI